MSLWWNSERSWMKGANAKHRKSLLSPPSPPEYDLSSKMVEPIFDYQFRVILIGDSTVGKSSLLRHFTDGTFAEVSDPTVGVDFFARLVSVSDGTVIKLQLWDTAGQERFRSITKSYYRNSVGVVLTYDICNQDSFNHVPVWMQEAKRHIEPHSAVFVLVGCKKDLADAPGNRQVDCSQAEEFARQHNIRHFETSAKSGLNIRESFCSLTQTVYDKLRSHEYTLDGGWDGIKGGYYSKTNLINSLTQVHNESIMLQGEATGKSWCC